MFKLNLQADGFDHSKTEDSPADWDKFATAIRLKYGLRLEELEKCATEILELSKNNKKWPCP